MALILSTLFLIAAFPVHAGESEDTLLFSNSETWAPYVFKGEDGEPRGLLVDYWETVGEKLAVSIDFALSDWNESLQRVGEKRSDVHAGLFHTEERDEYLDFSSPLKLELPTRLFVARGVRAQGLSDLGVLEVAVTSGGYSEHYLKVNHPLVRQRAYPSTKELVRAALSGEIQAFISDYTAAMYFLHKEGQPELFHAVETLYREKLYAAVPEGEEELLALVNRGIALMTQDDLDRIEQKWIQPVSRSNRRLFLLFAVIITLLCIAFVLFYIVSLKHQVYQRTRELERVSQIDSLTQLYNRFKIEDLFSNELYRFERYGTPLSLILLDIDNFKSVNDGYGHSVGDEVLVSIAALLSENLRKSDYSGRWGGEEFLVICPETTAPEAALLAEKLRQAVEKFDFPSIRHCTASFGVTAIQEGDNPSQAFIRADKALYESKQNGKNRVTSS